MTRSVAFALVGVKPDEPFVTRELDLSHDNPSILIGRSSKNRTGVIPKAENALFDCPVISRRHAELILQEEGELKIKDLESLHGTLVNHVKLAAYRPYPLKHGDVITIGNNITLGHQNFKAIVFQIHFLERRSNAEIIDLSSPIGSPRPVQPSIAQSAPPPIWAQPRTRLPAPALHMQPSSRENTTTFKVPDLDDDSETSDSAESGRDHKSTREGSPQLALSVAMNTEDSDVSISSSEYSDSEVELCEPEEPALASVDAINHEGDEGGQEADALADATAKRQPTVESQTEDPLCHSEYTEEQEEVDGSSVNPVFTPKTSNENSPASSPADPPHSQANQIGPQPKKATGFLSRILADTEIGTNWSQPPPQSLGQVPPAQSFELTPPTATLGPSTRQNANHYTGRTSIQPLQNEHMSAVVDSSPYDSCLLQQPTSQTLPESAKDVEQICQASSRPLQGREHVAWAGMNSSREDPLESAYPNTWDAFGPRASGRFVPALPFSTWAPAPHEPHPFYPVHGVGDAPLSIPPWDTPMSAARTARKLAPSPSPLPDDTTVSPITTSNTSLQSPKHAATGQSISPAINKEVGESRNDLVRMSIPHIVSAATNAHAPVGKSGGMGSQSIIEVPLTTKRKADIDGIINGNNDYNEAYPGPAKAGHPISDTVSADQQFCTIDSIPRSTDFTSPSVDAEPPRKRLRMSVETPNEHKPTLSRRPRARRTAQVATKYALAGAVGGVIALTGLLALPSSFFQ